MLPYENWTTFFGKLTIKRYWKTRLHTDLLLVVATPKCTWGWQKLFSFCVKIHRKVIKKKLPSRNMSVISQQNSVRKTFLVNFLWCFLAVYKSINACWAAIAQTIIIMEWRQIIKFTNLRAGKVIFQTFW